ncbi:Dynein light chain 1, cytoplasmic [Cichlidogyrus casuarinus]|uniref:Dynein light chain n=1 Tax=Cichlidogyrus casuarinus TaxID=1844966 RepID=A0ABD2PVM6_9PLAT
MYSPKTVRSNNMIHENRERSATRVLSESIRSTRSENRKATIKNSDMSNEMQQDSVEIASVALDQFKVEKDIASYLKKEFDHRYGPHWHCVVGKNFGSYVTHETKSFIYFNLDNYSFLLYKCG